MTKQLMMAAGLPKHVNIMITSTIYALIFSIKLRVKQTNSNYINDNKCITTQINLDIIVWFFFPYWLQYGRILSSSAEFWVNFQFLWVAFSRNERILIIRAHVRQASLCQYDTLQPANLTRLPTFTQVF